ncbi:hypothetical protein NL676_020680 [Syzygium grande]|nr:hypothetical protein NL676_020680 [Syzygium grande]
MERGDAVAINDRDSARLAESLATPLGNETTASRQPKTNGFAAVAFSLRDGEDEQMPKMEDAIGGLRPSKFYSVDCTPSPSSSRLCTPSHFSSRLYTHLSPALEFLLRLSAYSSIGFKQGTSSPALGKASTPLLTKTYQPVENPVMDNLISWNEDETTFIVWRPAEFAKYLLPKYFKHNNFASFVRQLKTYGFAVPPPPVEGKEELPVKGFYRTPDALLHWEDPVSALGPDGSSEISKDQVSRVSISVEINGDHLLQEVTRSRRPVYDLDERNYLGMSNLGTSTATIDIKLLKLTWRRLEGLAARLGGAKNIFCELKDTRWVGMTPNLRTKGWAQGGAGPENSDTEELKIKAYAPDIE